MKVIVLSGSLRAESFNTKLAKAFIAHAPKDVVVELIDISKLPFMNEDLETNPPQEVQQLHTTVNAADAVIFVTPEHNRSYTAVLKNALDWGSRPYGQNAWKHLPAGIVGATPYNLGTFGAQHHLRQVLTYLDMPTLQQPEFYLEQAGEKFDQNGQLIDPHTQEKVDQFWQIFITFATRNKRL